MFIFFFFSFFFPFDSIFCQHELASFRVSLFCFPHFASKTKIACFVTNLLTKRVILPLLAKCGLAKCGDPSFAFLLFSSHVLIVSFSINFVIKILHFVRLWIKFYISFFI